MTIEEHLIDEIDLEHMSLDNLFSRVIMCSYLYYELLLKVHGQTLSLILHAKGFMIIMMK